MLVSRAVLVYGMTPLVGKLPGSQPVERSYQTVMFWGGLRGAIALAIVLSLPEFKHSELFMPLTTGAVLFTLLVQGLSIEKLMIKLQLNRPPLSDRLALLERDLAAQTKTLERIPDLLRGGLFAHPIAAHLERKCKRNAERIRHEIADLRRQEMGSQEELMLLYLRAFSEEQADYQRLYRNGHISEGAYRELVAVLALQIDSIRYQGILEHVRTHHMQRLLENRFYRLLDRVSWGWLAKFGEGLRTRRIVRNYEEVLAHYQASGWILGSLDRMAAAENIPPEIVEQVRNRYSDWHRLARKQLDMISEQFPEFVTVMQERLSQRIALLAEREATEKQVDHGLLPPGIGESQIEELSRRLDALRTPRHVRLNVSPDELLRKVPFFHSLSHADFAAITPALRQRSAEGGEDIITQGDSGDSLFLIARGVIRVLRRDETHEEHELGTLLAGDFFGEQALLHDEPRNATCRAVTPCTLYQLRRNDFEQLRQDWPAIDAAMIATDKARHG